jgi:hypothetical protein
MLHCLDEKGKLQWLCALRPRSNSLYNLYIHALNLETFFMSILVIFNADT